MFVNIDSADNPSLMYQPGDHIAVFPQNHKSLVDAILAMIPQSPTADIFFRLQVQNKTDGPDSRWRNYKRLPPAVCLRKALTYFLDITSAPTQQFMAQLCMMCTSTDDRVKLEKIASVSFNSRYSLYCQYNINQRSYCMLMPVGLWLVTI